MRNILVLFITVVTSWAQAQLLSPGEHAEFIKNRKRYADIVRVLESVSNKQNVELFDLGVSDSGTVIKGIRVGNGDVHNLVVGTHHGNEYGAAEVAQAFAEHMAENPIVGQTVHIIPVLNANGYDRRSRREMAKGRTFDPNRDYPGPCGTQGPWNLKSTKALADYVARYPIINSATLHTYTPAVLYPWGISTHDVDTGYTDIFKEIGLAATAFSGYKVANSTLELYPADGTFEDYAYWRHGIWSMLFEMGFTHRPSEEAVAELIRVNVPGLRKMFEEAPVVRAPEHAFTGQCNGLAEFLDLAIE